MTWIKNNHGYLNEYNVIRIYIHMEQLGKLWLDNKFYTDTCTTFFVVKLFNFIIVYCVILVFFNFCVRLSS